MPFLSLHFWTQRVFRVLLCSVLSLHFVVDDFWTFSDSPWPCLHSYQTFHTNPWRISYCSETKKRLLQQWNAQVWNHIYREQEVFLSWFSVAVKETNMRTFKCNQLISWNYLFCFVVKGKVNWKRYNCQQNSFTHVGFIFVVTSILKMKRIRFYFVHFNKYNKERFKEKSGLNVFFTYSLTSSKREECAFIESENASFCLQ